MKRKMILVIAILALIASVGLLSNYNLLPAGKYSCEDFGISVITSAVDFDNDGTDDYTDILLGARKDAENHPRYDGRYFDTGYPPENIGVCTDVIWRAFRNAGYDLRRMVDQDIIRYPDDYPTTQRDSNIDFRRVRNLRVFFDRYAEKLTTSLSQTDQWQPGDIVVFNDGDHIGIVSDIRNGKGQPYFIHNGGQPIREEDFLKRNPVITAHYRWNAELIDNDILVRWED